MEFRDGRAEGARSRRKPRRCTRLHRGRWCSRVQRELGPDGSRDNDAQASRRPITIDVQRELGPDGSRDRPRHRRPGHLLECAEGARSRRKPRRAARPRCPRLVAQVQRELGPDGSRDLQLCDDREGASERAEGARSRRKPRLQGQPERHSQRIRCRGSSVPTEAETCCERTASRILQGVQRELGPDGSRDKFPAVTSVPFVCVGADGARSRRKPRLVATAWAAPAHSDVQRELGPDGSRDIASPMLDSFGFSRAEGARSPTEAETHLRSCGVQLLGQSAEGARSRRKPRHQRNQALSTPTIRVQRELGPRWKPRPDDGTYTNAVENVKGSSAPIETETDSWRFRSNVASEPLETPHSGLAFAPHRVSMA